MNGLAAPLLRDAASESNRSAGSGVRAATAPAPVELRRLPYPYRAALAICSDLDTTPNLEAYVGTMRLLNETGQTPGGPGLGLEVGNTIYFDMPRDQFSYWNTDDRGREVIRTLVRSGHIDCLHSFGDLATTRRHAGRALDDLARHGCAVQVWIDHAVAPSNFGADIMRGEGDVSESPAFHADLTCAFGIRYVWRGRVTSVPAQDVPRRLGRLVERRHPVASAITVAKESGKGLVGRAGSRKYAMHAGNALLRSTSLRSGQAVIEFLRCNPHWGGVSRGDTAEGLHEVLHEAALDELIDRGGVSILYTHLGKTARPSTHIGRPAVAALRGLARRHHEGRLLVTTTRRLLGSRLAVGTVTWSVHRDRTDHRIDVHTTAAGGEIDARDLDGLTFYVPDPARTRVRVDGTERVDLVRNPPDHTGRPSVSLPRPRLEFPRF